MARNDKSSKKRPAQNETNDTSDATATTTVEQISPFKYYTKGERARTDGAFLELLLTKVLTESGGLSSFDEMWPRGAQALAGLNVYRLSQHSASELRGVIGSVGGEFTDRMGRRANDLVNWADAFWRIKQIYGSFRQYLRSFDTDGHEALVGDLSQRLVGLSPEFLLMFLRDAGEKIPAMPQFERVAPPLPKPGREREAPQKQGRGSGGGGRRRRGGNASANGKSSEGGPAPKAKSEDTTPATQEKSGSRSRRGKRGFFRRRRGRGNNKSSGDGQAAAPTNTATE